MAHPLVFGEFGDGDFARSGAAACLESVVLGLEGLDGFAEGGALFDGFGIVGIGWDDASELCLVAA